MLRERGRITQHTGGAVGDGGRGRWSESVAGIFGRNLWSESLVGICGRNLWPESLVGIFGRNLWPKSVVGTCGRNRWSESVVGADVPGGPPSARDVRQSDLMRRAGRARDARPYQRRSPHALGSTREPVRTPRAEGGVGTAATSAALPHDAARFHFGTGRNGKVATCCGNVAGSRSTQGGGRGRRLESVAGTCGRDLWSESVAGTCGRNLWLESVVGICGRGRRPRRPALGAGRPHGPPR